MDEETFSTEELSELQGYISETVEIPKAFDSAEYMDRIDRLQDAMAARKLDVVILASPESQCWLHGYQSRWYRTGSTTEWPPLNFTAVTYPDRKLYLFDSEDHLELVRLTSSIDDIPDAKFVSVDKFNLNGIAETLNSALGLNGAQKCGIEMWSPRHNAAATDNLREQLKVNLEDVTIMMRNLQRIKSEKELDVMRNAARILDHAYAELVEALQKNKHLTEMEAWAIFESSMARDGGETAALHNTFAKTRNYYHALSSTREIGDGQFHADPCAVLHRYHVNAARQFYVTTKDAPRPEALIKASRVAAGALAEIDKWAHDGMYFKDLCGFLRDYYQRNGLWGTKDWIGGYQLGISFTPDWVGEFVWNVDEDNEPNRYYETRDPGDQASAKLKQIQSGLVTNFESYVGGAGLIETIVFKERGIEVLTSGTPGELKIIER